MLTACSNLPPQTTSSRQTSFPHHRELSLRGEKWHEQFLLLWNTFPSHLTNDRFPPFASAVSFSGCGSPMREKSTNFRHVRSKNWNRRFTLLLPVLIFSFSGTRVKIRNRLLVFDQRENKFAAIGIEESWTRPNHTKMESNENLERLRKSKSREGVFRLCPAGLSAGLVLFGLLRSPCPTPCSRVPSNRCCKPQPQQKKFPLSLNTTDRERESQRTQQHQVLRPTYPHTTHIHNHGKLPPHTGRLSEPNLLPCNHPQADLTIRREGHTKWHSA